MFPSEYQNQQHRNEMLKEAQNQALVKLATADSPSFWQRVADRLPNVEITAPSVRVVAKRPVEAIA
jgi:hypothetical protein